MVPDYLNYLLCGVPANEYTNASTTALVGADSRDWDDALIEKLGLPRGIFQPIKTAGTVLGHLTPDIQKAVGFDAEVILPATHDTGSAFLAVPARDEYAAYLSSGTWRACWAWKTQRPSPARTAAPPTLRTRAAMNTATVT